MHDVKDVFLYSVHATVSEDILNCNCVAAYNVCVGDISADIKTEPDISECPHVDVPSTGMFVFHDEQIVCTVFSLMFLSSNCTRCHK